jgi:hypothetical protein
VAKWNINRSGPQWLMDAIGRVVGYRDARGGEYIISQSTGAWGDAEALDAPTGATSVTPTNKSTAFTIATTDDGKVFNCTAALTITVPAGLVTRPQFAVMLPPTGNVSIAVTGGAQVNGATATLTRSRATNPAGFVVSPYSESDGYGVSGS